MTVCISFTQTTQEVWLALGKLNQITLWHKMRAGSHQSTDLTAPLPAVSQKHTDVFNSQWSVKFTYSSAADSCDLLNCYIWIKNFHCFPLRALFIKG